MEVSEILGALRDYETELGDMLDRFTRNRDGLHIDRQDHYRLRILTTELIDILRDHVPGSRQHTVLIMNSYNDGISNFSGSSSYASVEEIRGVVTAIITRVERNKSLFSGQDGLVTWTDERKRLLDAIDRIIERFHLVAKQLRSRREDRPTLDVSDEYDVQDLLHALLRLYFEDVRPEEWTPSYAGKSSRTDFLLPEIDPVVETKKPEKA